MARIDSFLRMVAEQKASDLHFHAGVMPMIRHDGELVELPFRPLASDETRRFLNEILTPQQRERFEEDGELDFAYDLVGVARFRVNLLVQSRGPGAVFRIIPTSTPTLDQLGMPQPIKKLCRLSSGLVLITGPTGSGKTTTLSAMVNEMNRTQSRHIITVEDPIEFVHEPVQCVVTQRQVGSHVDSFATALRSSLRESPDVLVVGEMRDLETVSLALQAAETGVLVFGTLHTNSAAKAVDRITDVFPEEQQEQARGLLSVLLKGVVAQQLVRRASGEGRVAALELLLTNYAISNMIRESKTYQIDSYLQSGEAQQQGMMGLEVCLRELARERIITVEEALTFVPHSEALRELGLTLNREEPSP
jgi:twitching motility protein PilT